MLHKLVFYLGYLLLLAIFMMTKFTWHWNVKNQINIFESLGQIEIWYKRYIYIYIHTHMNYEDKKKKKKEKEIPFGRGLVLSLTVLLFDLLFTT